MYSFFQGTRNTRHAITQLILVFCLYEKVLVSYSKFKLTVFFSFFQGTRGSVRGWRAGGGPADPGGGRPSGRGSAASGRREAHSGVFCAEG